MPSVNVQAAVELCWLTCVSSALNGEELTRSGGVTVLGALLTRTASVLPAESLPTVQSPGAERHAAPCVDSTEQHLRLSSPVT